MNLEQHLIEIFQEFHQFPELSNEEYETTARIRNILEEAGIEILELPLKTGLVARIEGKQKEPVIALRCDIDALPVCEETELSYKSKNAGKMHACGHDFHITTMIGTALRLKERQQDLNGTVKILFQPAEESSNGAVQLINTDILSDVKAIFGVHSAPDLAVGEVGIIVGPATASVDRFEIEVTGVGAHAAHPDLGIDPIVTSAHIITALQTIVSRNLDPFDTALISVTNLHSGNTWNVIPPTAYMEGTVRTLNAKTREFIPSRMRCTAEQVAAAFGATAKLNWYPSTPATNNSKVWAEFAKQIALEKDLQIAPYSVSLIGEDFAAYQAVIEGVFLFVGTGKNYPLHHPKFYVDTSAIIGSVEYFVHLAEQSMNRLA